MRDRMEVTRSEIFDVVCFRESTVLAASRQLGIVGHTEKFCIGLRRASPITARQESTAEPGTIAVER